MSFILKILAAEASPVASDNEHSLYADITSVRFHRSQSTGEAMAECWVREPVKTAECQGFVDVPLTVTFEGVAYVMNENGKTVSSFTARTSGASDDPK